MSGRSKYAARNALMVQLRLARRGAGLTQLELADQIRAKCHFPYKKNSLKQLISRLERGEAIPYRADLVKALTEFFGPLDANERAHIALIDDAYSREVLIDIFRDGSIAFRRRSARSPSGSFPIFSVRSEEEARLLQIRACHRMPRPDPRSPGHPWFVFIPFTKAMFRG